MSRTYSFLLETIIGILDDLSLYDLTIGASMPSCIMATAIPPVSMMKIIIMVRLGVLSPSRTLSRGDIILGEGHFGSYLAS